MPGRDRTGPEGKGPRTGWGSGFCAKNKDKESDAFQLQNQKQGTSKQRISEFQNQGRNRFRGNRN